jgi:hypothetical protein
MSARLLRTRFPGTCAACGCPLPAGTSAWWDSGDKTLRCQACDEGSQPPATDAVPPVDDNGVAGGSAQRKYDRLHDRREHRVRTAHPRIGGLLLALSNEPQSTTAWAVGAEGERRVGAWLDTLTSAGALVLHDRRVLRSKAKIDHLVVAPSGVWVIDSKHYDGRIECRDVGGWFRRDERPAATWPAIPVTRRVRSGPPTKSCVMKRWSDRQPERAAEIGLTAAALAPLLGAQPAGPPTPKGCSKARRRRPP